MVTEGDMKVFEEELQNKPSEDRFREIADAVVGEFVT